MATADEHQPVLSPSQVVKQLTDHVRAQELARQIGRDASKDFKESETEKHRRDATMRQLPAALNLSRVELQNKLGIDRATWDRWRSLTTVPNRSHLAALERFALQRERGGDEEQSRPKPLDMLSYRPWTWGRLRLVYSLFRWEDAVFSFNSTFADPATVTEMALLALRGCNIVYLLRQDPLDWITEYAKNLVTILGEQYAARALSRVCVVDNKDGPPTEDFGLFNYVSSERDFRVGYIWTGAHSRPVSDLEPNVYRPVSIDDLLPLNERLAEMVIAAFDEIQSRVQKDFWATPDSATLDSLLRMPLVESQRDANGHFPVKHIGKSAETSATL